MRQWRKSHPLNPEQRQKHYCRDYARVYRRRGKLERQPCQVCGNQNSQMHHDNYQEPLQVKWLCREHHLEFHRLRFNDELMK